MRFHLLPAVAFLALTVTGAQAQPGPRLMPAVDTGGEARLVLASTRHPKLRQKIEADEADATPSKHHRRGKAAAASDTVTVKSGDTLYSLSNRAHSNVEEVAKLNGLKPPYALKLGQVLRLPGSGAATKAEATTDEAEAACPKRRGRKACLAKAAAAAQETADVAPQTPRERRKAVAELKAAQAACPKHKGRQACLAAAKAAQAEAASPAETIAFDLKACRRHKTRRACAAEAKAAETASAAPKGVAAAPAEALFDLKACRRHASRRTCAAREKTAQAAAEETTAASARQAWADVASAEQALKACRRHHRARACVAEAKAVTEAKAAAPTPAPSRKDAADAATAALNLKACRRRHSRRDCAAQASVTPVATVAATTAPSRATRPAATPEPDTGVSAESMVASLPPTAPTSSARTRTRLSGDVSTPPPATATVTRPETARATAPAVADVSPGPRPYASVFGGASAPARTSGRSARDRSGRTSQDAQAAAAAAARRDYARASIPAVPLPGAGDAVGRPRFSWPVSGEVLSGFGPKGSGLRNDGVDLAASLGDPVRASAAGEVVYAGGAIPGFGNLVLVKHPGGWVTAYGHLSKISVAMRQAVRQGDVVGEVGQSGNVLRPELHFEIRYATTPEENAKPVDPAPLLPRRG